MYRVLGKMNDEVVLEWRDMHDIKVVYRIVDRATRSKQRINRIEVYRQSVKIGEWRKRFFRWYITKSLTTTLE
jgi:hypothetical protein